MVPLWGKSPASEVLHQDAVSGCRCRGLGRCPLGRPRIPLVELVLAGYPVDGVVDVAWTKPSQRKASALAFPAPVGAAPAIVATAIAFQVLMTAGSAAPMDLSTHAAGIAASSRTRPPRQPSPEQSASPADHLTAAPSLQRRVAHLTMLLNGRSPTSRCPKPSGNVRKSAAGPRAPGR